MSTYNNPEGRINKVKGEILAHAQPYEVLAHGVAMKQMPRNQGDNIIYRRYLPRGATNTDHNSINRPFVDPAAHLTQEGVTPKADQLVHQDISVKQNRYDCMYTYTDKAELMHEDDIPEQLKIQAGERMGLVREMIRFGTMKACTNVIYAGGSSRASVDEAISLVLLRREARTLMANHARKKRRILAPSPAYETRAIEAAYIVFVHTDAAADIRDLPGFVKVAEYGSRQPISDEEIGSCEEFRFLLSSELAPYNAAGAAVGATGLASIGSTNVDVYPFIVCGEDAVCDVALRGSNSFKVKHIPVHMQDKSDPGGQRGYIHASFYCAVLITNQGWMGVIEAGVSNLA